MEAVSTAFVNLVKNSSYGERIDDNKDILITICICGQWSNMVQMKDFKRII